MTLPKAGPWVDSWLSPGRFAPYLAEAKGDRDLALELYEWNVAISSAIMHDLSHVEIAVRNAYDAAWTRHARPSGSHWTRVPMTYFPTVWKTAADGTSFDENAITRDQISVAVKRAGGPAALPGKIIAELSFSFWRYLTKASHERTLWRPILSAAFRTRTLRRDVDAPMNRLLQLRNRVAHHEHLLGRDLAASHRDVLRITDLISGEVHSLVVTSTTWPQLLATRPT